VNFIEQIAPVDQSIQPDVSRVGPLQLDPPSLPGFLPDLALLRASDQDGERSALQRPAIENRWLMHSDVCKHCANAGCVQACPTGALFHTEFGTVVVQQDICNGCGYCIPSCPFGVVALNLDDGRAHKCTLCYDRLKGGLEPACAKSCPTDSIEFGPVSQLREKAERRVSHLRQRGVNNAYLYGTPGSHGTSGGIERLNSISLLLDRPETYNLPAAPTLPSTRIKPGFIAGLLTMAAVTLSALAAFDDRRSNSQR
jgi:formate dehydrogenase iron-sulfur subunit